MTTSWKIRPSLLALIIIVALAAAMTMAGTQSATADNSAVAPELEGTWLVTVTLEGGPSFPSLVSYARGGALVVTDSGPGPAAGNVYQGTWTKTGPHEFTFTFLGLQFDTNGVFANYLRGHETFRLETGGNAYNGVTVIEVLDTNMNLIESYNATTHGTRVNAQ